MSGQAGSARLSIEPLQPGHAAELFEAMRDPRVHELVDPPAPATAQALEEDIRRLQCGAGAGSGERWLNWALRRRDLGCLIGTLQATVEGQQAWIGYMLGPAAWGLGFATEAVLWLIDELRDRHGVRLLRASVDARNLPSVRVLERAGFANLGPHAAELHGQASTDLQFERVLAAPAQPGSGAVAPAVDGPRSR